MSDDKSSLTEKIATGAAIGAGLIGAAAVIPQDELMKQGLPSFWESVKGIAQLNWLRLEEAAKKFRPVAFTWGAKLWSFIKWWTLMSFALIFAGIEVKTRFGSNFGHVLVAAGTISFAGLGIMLFTLTDGIASLLYLKLKIAGSVFGKVTSLVGVDLPKIIEADDLQKFRDKVRIVLAGATVLCFSLLFTMFFPAWSTLGWTMCFWAMVGVALCAALYLDMKMGKAVQVVFYITIALIVGTFVIFVLDRLTGGALGFSGFQTWLRAVNGSEVVIALLVLIPGSLLIVSAFAKDKDRKSAFKQSAKYVGVAAFILGAFLLYKGTVSWKQLSGKEPPKMVTETIEKVETTSFKGFGKESPTEKASAPRGSASNGAQYMAPPSGSQPQNDGPAPAARASTPRAKKPPLPPLKAKTYGDAASAVDDLQSLL